MALLAFGAGLFLLIIGLTVVAFGTSSPKLAMSLKAALDDHAGIGSGNSFFNILGVLRLTGQLAPLGIAVSDAMLGSIYR